MSFAIARAFMFGVVVPQVSSHAKAEPEAVGPTEEQLSKIREMFAPKEEGNE